jgi:hypothetical protein
MDCLLPPNERRVAARKTRTGEKRAGHDTPNLIRQRDLFEVIRVIPHFAGLSLPC